MSMSPQGIDPYSRPGIEASPPSSDITTDWSQWMRWDGYQDEVPSSAVVTPPFEDPQQLGSATSNEAIDMLSPQYDVPAMNQFTFGNYGIPHNGAVVSQYEQPPPPIQEVPQTLSRQNSFYRSTKKRKSEISPPPSSPERQSVEVPPTQKKRSHNVIEKRYRANLNDKIAELRDAVPSLRVAVRQRAGVSNTVDDLADNDLIGSGNGKLNKANILSKATEYIHYLEAKNKRVAEENRDLKIRTRHLEKSTEQLRYTISCGNTDMNNACFNPGMGGPMVTTPTSFAMSNDYASSGDSPPFSAGDTFSSQPSDEENFAAAGPVEGMIKIPDYMKSMQPSGPQPNYAESYQYSNARGGGASRFMLGALATLMFVGIERQGETSDGASQNERGLLAVPINLVTDLISRLVNLVRLMRSSTLGSAPVSLLVSAGIIFSFASCIFWYLYNLPPASESIPKAEAEQTKSSNENNGAYNAWLTSVQTVWIPGSNILMEGLAVAGRCMEYLVRCFLGWHVYSSLTGITSQYEDTRVKAWDIAIGAQLTGGDNEVSRSRLILTLFAAGTLPYTPERLMLKALHVRLVLWGFGPKGSYRNGIANTVARYIARYQWNSARDLLISLPKAHPDHLPQHLVTLLFRPCDDVLNDAVVQRAMNMIFKVKSPNGANIDDVMLNIVVKDPTLSGPLDRLAAWSSSQRLQHVLLTIWDQISTVNEAGEMPQVFIDGIEEAFKLAPQGSIAQVRALIMKAIFCEDERVSNINEILTLLTLTAPSSLLSTPPRSGILAFSENGVLRDVELRTAIRCSMIMAILKRQVIQHGGQLIGVGGRVQLNSSSSGPSVIDPLLTAPGALDAFKKINIDPTGMGLIGCAAIWWTLKAVAQEESYLNEEEKNDKLQASNDLSEESSIDDSEPEYSSETSTLSNGENRRSVTPVQNTSTSDVSRIAVQLADWALHAYGPVSYGFTPAITGKLAKECREVSQVSCGA